MTSWTSVFTYTTPTNVLLYIAPEAGSDPRRFCLAFQFP